MDKHTKKSNISKIYCEKCDTVFESKEKFAQHRHDNSSVSCDSCPLDVLVQKFVNLFKRN